MKTRPNQKSKAKPHPSRPRLKKAVWVALAGVNLSLVSAFAHTSPVAAQAQTCQETVAQQVSFKSDQTLLTVLAWLNWVGDRDEEIDLSHYDPIQQAILKLIKQMPPSTYQKHRQAYDAYLPKLEPYYKNGLLLIDSQYYGPAPHFKLSIPTQGLNTDEQARAQQLPPPALLNEFYQTLQLDKHWQATYQQVHLNYQQKYEAAVRQGLQRAQCFLKVPLTAPVDIVLNPLDAFGTSGQTSYNAKTKRFLIKLHIDLEYTDETSIEETAAHEYTHVLMNELLKPYQAAFSEKLAAVGTQTKQDFEMPVQELLARSVGYMEKAKQSDAYRDNITYYGKNILFPHFISQISDYESRAVSFADYLPAFLDSFDAQAGAEQWLAISEQKESHKKPPSQLSQQEQSLLAAAAQASALLKPKLLQFQTQVKQELRSTDPKALLLNCFQNREYLKADSAIRENVHYIYKNPLYYLFSERFASLTPGTDSQKWVNQLFEAFDVKAEVLRWQSIQQRVEAEK